MSMTDKEALGNEGVSQSVSDASISKRGPGRPKGLGKVPGSGRKKGGKNWTTDEIRSALLNKSEAIETLADICAGRLIRVSGPTGKQMDVFPSLPERLRAAELVLKKAVPDLVAQSIEMTGKDGKDLIGIPYQDPRQLSRAILSVLGQAQFEDAPDETAGQSDDRSTMPDGSAVKHTMTAAEFPDAFPLDLSDPDAGDPEPKPDTTPVDAGPITIGKATIEPAGGKKWRVLHGDGTLHRICPDRTEAEAQAGALTW